MKLVSFIAPLAVGTTLLLVGCGGSEGGTGDAASNFQSVTPDYQDVVISTDSDPAEVEAAAAPPPPGEVAPPPVVEDTEQQRLSRMTARERAEYDEQMKAINESKATESANHSVLLGDIRQAVENYHLDHRALPSDMRVLVQKGYLQAMPRIPAGKKLRIDGTTLEVTLE